MEYSLTCPIRILLIVRQDPTDNASLVIRLNNLLVETLLTGFDQSIESIFCDPILITKSVKWPRKICCYSTLVNAI